MKRRQYASESMMKLIFFTLTRTGAQCIRIRGSETIFFENEL